MVEFVDGVRKPADAYLFFLDPTSQQLQLARNWVYTDLKVIDFVCCAPVIVERRAETLIILGEADPFQVGCVGGFAIIDLDENTAASLSLSLYIYIYIYRG